MGERGAYFVKGGFGCLGVFVALGVVALLVGGTFYLDIGGALLLFLVGGAIGLLYLWAKRRGRAEAVRDFAGPDGTSP